MAILTKLSKKQVASLLSNYKNYENRKFLMKGVSEGTVNTLYRLTFDDEVLYLKIDEVGNRARLQREIALLAYLSTKKLGIAIPKLVPTDRERHYIPLVKKFVTLQKEVPGFLKLPSQLKPKHLAQTGHFLNRLHKLSKNLPAPAHKWNVKELQKLYTRLRPDLERWDPMLADYLTTHLNWLKQHENQRSKKVLIHGDLFLDNLHWDKNLLCGVLDFEYAGLGSPGYDYAMTHYALAWKSNKLKPMLATALKRGYPLIKTIPQKQLAFDFRHAALTIILTRLMTFEFGQTSVKSKLYRSYEDFVIRLDWANSQKSF